MPLLADLQGPPGPAQRRALSKAITLLESTRAEDRARADALLDALLPQSAGALRIGISGSPGVGKSSFIEAFGLHLLAQGRRPAVLAVDPSSSINGGSILADKTRMERLSADPRAYIRPSPAAGTLGGVAERTREATLVCAAAGYDTVIVETVGVGQSEIMVAGMTDVFVLLQLPFAGDELQAIKKGVMELADMVLVNKADIDAAAAVRAQAQIAGSLRLVMRPQAGGGHADEVPVLTVSARSGAGIDAFWRRLLALADERRASGAFDARRRLQALAWLWQIVDSRLRARFAAHPAVRAALPALLADVEAARSAPSAAARALLDLFEAPSPWP